MKEILKQFKWLILFCLVSPFIVYIILITPSPIGIVAREDVGALLGYYGAILGGFMTLSGVWWTIDAQNKQRDEDNKQHENERLEELSIRYKPYILLEHVEEWNQYSVINYDGKHVVIRMPADHECFSYIAEIIELVDNYIDVYKKFFKK